MKQPLQTITVILASIALTVISALAINLPASANTKLTELAVSPAKATPELKKGQTYNGEFTVYNSGEVDLKVKVSASLYDSSYGGYKLSSSDNNRSLIHKWIKFDKSEIEVKAKSNTVVKYTINTPKDIPDGGQYGLISVETINNQPVQASGVATVLRLNMLVYASTDGQNHYSGDLTDVKIPFLNIGSNNNFSFKATNTGNTHYELNSEFTISDMFGKQKLSMQKSDLALPGLDKTITFNWDRSPLFALVKVHLKANGLDKKIDETKTVLFVSPVFFIILATIIVILGATYVANKKLKYTYKK